MFRLPIFGKKKLLLALEYGMTISETAKQMKVELTPEFVKRAEIILMDEFKKRTPSKIAGAMLVTILAIFEIKESNK